MKRDPVDDGWNRRTVLGTLSAMGALGTGTFAGTVGAQTDDGDAYHDALLADLQETYGLPAGEFVYGSTEAETIDAFALEGAGSGSETAFDVEADVPFTRGVRIEVAEEPSNNYDYTYQGFVTDRSFEAGDVLLGVASLRSETDGAEVQAGFKYRYTDSNGETSYSSTYVTDGATVQPTAEWTRYYFPIEVGEKPDGSEFEPYIEFWTGFTEQTVEFGGVALVDYGDADVAVGDLPAGSSDGAPSPLIDYEGREAGAQWRSEAEDRIDEVRKSDLGVTVVDSDGTPVPDAAVSVRMQEHAFDFGSAVSAEHVNGDGDDDETYRETFLEDFNVGVLENALKYPSFRGSWGDSKEGALAALDWLAERDVPARGHYLVWEEYGTDGGGGMAIEDPDSLSDEELQTRMLDLIRNHATDVGDRVAEWDMHNHPIWQSAIRDRLGWDAVLEWWEAGNEATDAELYTNEMGNVAGGFNRDQHYEFVERLLDDGAPVDGVGFMGHAQLPEGNVTPPAELLSTYDRFAELDLPVLITEFDVQIDSRDDEEEVEWQTDYLRDFLTASFSHEAVEGVISWGFWADDHWRPTGAYYDSDWTLRPHGEQYHDLVYDEWWTEEDGETDVDGAYATRAFRGEYEITVEYEGESATRTTTLSEGGVTEEFRLDVEVATPTESPTETESATPATDTDATEASGPGLGVASALAGVGGYALARRHGDADDADDAGAE